MERRSLVLLPIAAAIVGILAWQIWDAHGQAESKWLDTDRPDCQAWDAMPQRNETATWTGGCRSGKAEGEGLLTWTYTDRTGLPQTETYSGRLVAGTQNGHATTVYADGGRYEGSYADGKKDGQGTRFWADGTQYSGAWKAAMPNGFGTYTAGGVSHSGQWKEGCLDDGSGISLRDGDECDRIVGKVD